MKKDEIERVDIDRWQSSYLVFTDEGFWKVGGKTRQFNVYSKSNRSLLGTIKWWGGWRKYVFFPLNSLFDNVCLRNIATFCEEATATHMSRLPNKKRLKDIEKARRQRRIEKLAKKKENNLTNEEDSVSIDFVDEVVQPENGLVEGVQPNAPNFKEET